MDSIDYLNTLNNGNSSSGKLRNIKIVTKVKINKKYDYVELNQKTIGKKNIIIMINSSQLKVIDSNNKVQKSYSKIRNGILLKIYKKLIKMYKMANKNKLKVIDILIKISAGEVIDYSFIQELDSLLTAYLLPYEKRLDYIYNYLCDCLDLRFAQSNCCDFVNDRCVSRRELECKGCKNPVVYGCCYTKNRVCPYLIEHHCSIKCVSCKLFTCRYLEKRGIKYRSGDFLIAKIFFNYRQRLILNNSIYTPKEVIIDKLIKRKSLFGK